LLPATTQTNIDLGSYSYITLNGSVEVTLKGSPITPGGNSSIEVRARPNADYSGPQLGYGWVDASGNWTMLVEPSSSPRDFYFEVYVSDYNTGKSRSKGTGESLSVSNSPISNINLGTVVWDVITLSGTVSGTVDGSPPDGCMVAAWIADENKVLGYANAKSDGTWSIEVDALDSNKTVSFIAAPIVGNDAIFTRLGSNYNKTVHNFDVSGINLTGLAITTKTIQINITNGSTPAPGSVVICNSQISLADMNTNDTMWLKVIAMPAMIYDSGGGPVPASPNWSLKVPGDTGGMYFLVMTDSNEVYTSTSPVSGNTVTLNLSTMTKLN
jgi:hypothetical protein